VGSLDYRIGVNHEDVKVMLEACLEKTGDQNRNRLRTKRAEIKTDLEEMETAVETSQA
jgi:hypothetical protein